MEPPDIFFNTKKMTIIPSTVFTLAFCLSSGFDFLTTLHMNVFSRSSFSIAVTRVFAFWVKNFLHVFFSCLSNFIYRYGIGIEKESLSKCTLTKQHLSYLSYLFLVVTELIREMRNHLSDMVCENAKLRATTATNKNFHCKEKVETRYRNVHCRLSARLIYFKNFTPTTTKFLKPWLLNNPPHLKDSI